MYVKAGAMMLAAALFVAGPGVSFAQTKGEPAVAGDATRAAAGKKVRCRSQRVTGSLLRSTRICMTEREWAIQRERAQGVNSLACADRTVCAGS